MGTTSRFGWLRGVQHVLLILLVTVIGVRAYLQAGGRTLDPSPAAPVRTIFIKPKTGVHEIAQILREAGVIQSRWGFLALAYLQGSLPRLHAGEYEFGRDASLLEVLRKLEAGRVVTHQVTFPEGFSAQEIARVLAGEQLVDFDRFLSLVSDRDFAAELGLHTPGLEGYLFPDTYRLTRGMGEAEILRLMVARFRRMLPPDVRERARAVGLDLHQVITLASLIEKEARLERERPLISAVFHNRLRREMPLQSDPTAVYGLPAASGRRITATDLQRESPYNTYLRSGLPPGPIASPGLDAIMAALRPARTDYLYFVAKNDGSHVFSRTLGEHSRAVGIYQRRGRGAGE